MSKYMSKVINFPTHIRKQAIEDEMLEIDEEITEFVEECKEAAQTTLLMIEELLLNEYGETFDDLDFRDDSLSESSKVSPYSFNSNSSIIRSVV